MFDAARTPRGNRGTLSFDQLDLLENKILPTARRWVREIPGLADHGRQTLEYWGEEIPTPREQRGNSKWSTQATEEASQ